MICEVYNNICKRDSWLSDLLVEWWEDQLLVTSKLFPIVSQEFRSSYARFRIVKGNLEASLKLLATSEQLFPEISKLLLPTFDPQLGTSTSGNFQPSDHQLETYELLPQ